MKAYELVNQLKEYNLHYRQGNPLIPDEEYEVLIEQLRDIDPTNPYLSKVEPEPSMGKKKYAHPEPMLSMLKVKTGKELLAFIKRCEEANESNDIIQFRILAKLDGLAGRLTDCRLFTRGNGTEGEMAASGCERMLIKGESSSVGESQAPDPMYGEIVTSKSYFAKHLSEEYADPRSFTSGKVNSDVVSPNGELAITMNEMVFYPYSKLPYVTVSINELKTIAVMLSTDEERGFEMMNEFVTETEFPTDGLIIEAVSQNVKDVMGSGSSYHNWRVAFKFPDEGKETTVTDIIWQVGRTGAVTPVLIIDPVTIDGVTITRVTGHNAGMVASKGVGTGAVVEVTRAGMVIPYLKRVITKALTDIPDDCPACSSRLASTDSGVMCVNKMCTAIVQRSILHFFKTTETADLFGPATIMQLMKNAAVSSADEILNMNEEQFLAAGFGAKQARNLSDQLTSLRTVPIDDWKVLASAGIELLGRSMSKRLLTQFTLWDITETPEKVCHAEGIDGITREAIINGIFCNQLMMFKVAGLLTIKEKEAKLSSSLEGKTILFTGKLSNPRKEMEVKAEAHGAKVVKSVSKNTDILVCGEKAGSKKEKAQGLGSVSIIDEEEFYNLIGEQM